MVRRLSYDPHEPLLSRFHSRSIISRRSSASAHSLQSEGRGRLRPRDWSAPSLHPAKGYSSSTSRAGRDNSAASRSSAIMVGKAYATKGPQPSCRNRRASTGSAADRQFVPKTWRAFSAHPSQLRPIGLWALARMPAGLDVPTRCEPGPSFRLRSIALSRTSGHGRNAPRYRHPLRRSASRRPSSRNGMAAHLDDVERRVPAPHPGRGG